jgi:hypothetical protein
MFVFPILSITWEHFFAHSSLPLISLVSKWFAFWAAGVRLTAAGLRQLFQPRFTATKIFAISTDEVLPIVRELGIANFAMGLVGILSLFQPTFVLPVSIAAAVFYGVAGLCHITDKRRSANQNLTMLTDLLASTVFLAFIAFTLFGSHAKHGTL